MRRASSLVLRHTLHWIGSADMMMLLAVLAIVGSLFLFVGVAELVHGGEWQQFDSAVLKSLRNPSNLSQPVGPFWLTDVCRDLTALGGYTFLTLLMLIVLGFLLLSRKHHAFWLVLTATLGGWALSEALKALFARPRPDVVPHLARVHSASFPSGHSMISAVVYLTLGSLLARMVRRPSLKMYFIVVALVLSLLVGLTRIYLGVHYPTDVLGGWTAGLAWAILCWLAARVLQRRHVIEPPQ